MAGALPNVRIAAWAGLPGGGHATGISENGPLAGLPGYGEMVEVSAIVGAVDRNGVDMVWGTEPIYGHFGLDLTGANGGLVRIDDIRIEDVTHVFHRDIMNWVDVRDYGAKGDGITDDSAAFAAADEAAEGRRVLVSKGVYFLGDHVTLENRVQFEGTVEMPDDKILSLTKSFDLPTYIDAFGDEELGLKKGLQSLFNNSDHESLDLGGRRVNLTAPIDVHAAVGNRVSYAQRRVIRNGQLQAADTPAWETEVVQSQGTYNPSAATKQMTNVTNVANIPVGALVEGTGVGREVYVRSKNVGAQTLELSEALYDGAGTQVFTFRRFKYMLDFSGFSALKRFCVSDIEFDCNARASGILLAPQGLIFHVRDCFFNEPADRGITSHGSGCQGLLVDRCQFLSSEIPTPAQSRKTIAINANANDVKLRNNRSTQIRHFAVLSGANSVITGNHFFQGDGIASGPRTAGIVLTRTTCATVIGNNYVDNCFIEWSNEHDSVPAFDGGFSFGALTITGNTFLASNVAPWVSFIVVKPHGAGHFVNGLSITGNIFRSVEGTMTRIEKVDTSFATLDYGRCKNVTITGNMFNNIDELTENPVTVRHDQNTEAKNWIVQGGPHLAFGGWARMVSSVAAIGAIRDTGNVRRQEAPHIDAQFGPNNDQVELTWSRDLRGAAQVTMRMDL